jgi:hypothetical protein
MTLAELHIMQGQKEMNELIPGLWKDRIMASFKLISRDGLKWRWHFLGDLQEELWTWSEGTGKNKKRC